MDRIPFYTLAEGQDPLSLDPSNFFYFLAKDGVYQVRRTPFYTSVTKAACPDLPVGGTSPSLSVTFPNLPARLLSQVGSFFLWAHRVKKGEAVVMLFLDQSTGEWSAQAPVQWIPVYGDSKSTWSSLNIKYEPNTVVRPKGTLQYGTIHSHCDSPAGHSGTDIHDEMWGDGIHVTFGHLDHDFIDISAEFVSNRTRFPYKWYDLMDEFTIEENSHPVEWESMLTRKKVETKGWSYGGGYGWWDMG